MTVAALLFLAASPLPAQTPTPDGQELEAQGARVGRIFISRENLFDPRDPHESYWPYRLANKLHVVTREEVIRRELLFREGDLYSQELVDESERNLRGLKVIYHVRIVPLAYRDGVVDLEVNSQDTWTLRPAIRFSRAVAPKRTGPPGSGWSEGVQLSVIMWSVDRATCADRTTDRQAHTRAAAVARHGTDSATIAGTAGPSATAHTRGQDPRRAGS